MSKAQVNLQGLLIGIAAMSLFLGVFGTTILLMSPDYDATGYDKNDLDKFNKQKNLTVMLDDVQKDVANVNVQNSWLDFFSGIWSKLTQPFRFVYRSYTYLNDIGELAVQNFKLMPVFREFISSLIITLVIVGIVMIKFYFGRRK